MLVNSLHEISGPSVDRRSVRHHTKRICRVKTVRDPMIEQPVCSADDCDAIIPDDLVELVEVPVEGTGEWIDTGERDEEFGLEITEWTGDW